MANHTIDKFTYGGETYILQDNTSGYITGISSSDVTTALGYTPYNSTNPNGYTSNIGTITGITMNGSSKGTSGVVDLGTVITTHQSIKTINNTSLVGSGNISVQPTLVSGTNIKTINNESLLGSGDITVGATAMTDTEVIAAVDDAFVYSVYNITLNNGSNLASVQNLQEQTVTTGIVGETYMVVCDSAIDSISSTPQVTFQLDSTRKTAYFVMPDEAISIDVYVLYHGGEN